MILDLPCIVDGSVEQQGHSYIAIRKVGPSALSNSIHNMDEEEAEAYSAARYTVCQA